MRVAAGRWVWCVRERHSAFAFSTAPVQSSCAAAPPVRLTRLAMATKAAQLTFNRVRDMTKSSFDVEVAFDSGGNRGRQADRQHRRPRLGAGIARHAHGGP